MPNNRPGNSTRAIQHYFSLLVSSLRPYIVTDFDTGVLRHHFFVDYCCFETLRCNKHRADSSMVNQPLLRAGKLCYHSHYRSEYCCASVCCSGFANLHFSEFSLWPHPSCASFSQIIPCSHKLGSLCGWAATKGSLCYWPGDIFGTRASLTAASLRYS